MRSHRHLRCIGVVAAAAMLAGCATFGEDGGIAPARQAARDRLNADIAWARTDNERTGIDERVDELLARPLTMDTAVRLALLNNRGLQAAFFELGIAEADLVQAGRLPNPGFSFGKSRRGDEMEIERSVHLNLARLIALPMLQQIESRRFAQAQQQAAMKVLALAADTRKAWVEAVASQEFERYARQVMEAAQAGAELARRMAAAGNFNRLQYAREQAFHADAATNLARAQQARQAARERLTRLLGLWGTRADFRLPDRLPDLPTSPRELPEVERVAIEQRLDVQAARVAVDQAASNLGLTNATRFVNVFEFGLMRNSSNEAPTQKGWEVGFEIPLFDWSGARVAKARGAYMQTVNLAAQTAIDARSEARQAYAAYRFAWDIAKHQRDEIVPLKKRIADENLLRYNGMLIGVFELLADARSQIASVNTAIDALRAFWVAHADLEMALVGKPTLTVASGAAAMAGPAVAGH